MKSNHENFRGKAVSSSTTVIGTGRLDISKLQKDELHECVVECTNERKQKMGKVKLALTISGADSSGAKEAKYIAARDNKTYGYLRTFGGGGIHDVGILKVTLHCANGLIACDSFGKSDPYCYVDLGNQRFRSRTIYKTVNPEWNRVFYLDITELYQNLFITLYDEDENDADDFMGKLCVPILEMKGKFKVFFIEKYQSFYSKT